VEEGRHPFDTEITRDSRKAREVGDQDGHPVAELLPTVRRHRFSREEGIQQGLETLLVAHEARIAKAKGLSKKC